MATRINLVGETFGRLVVTESTDKQNKWGNYFWKCKCSCGNEVEVVGGNLTQGTTKSCGCLQKELQQTGSITHGKTKTPEHYSWQDIRKRCSGKTAKMQRDYVDRGITVHPDFESSFELFYAEIGPRPDDGQIWSVGRIDNSVGYTYGNIRWETPAQQARNKTRNANNKTGVAGVVFNNGKFVAICNMLDGKRKSKSFNVSKYGHNEAFALAVAARKKMIEDLNLQGAGYSPSHGCDK